MKEETKSLQTDFNNHACTKKDISSNDGNQMIQAEHLEKETGKKPNLHSLAIQTENVCKVEISPCHSLSHQSRCLML